MREILFRGKRLDNGCWITGAYHPGGGRHFIFPLALATETTKTKVIPETVGQFTGLLDKHGKRIFEGDVVRYGNRTGYVIFGNGCFCVQDSTTQNHPAIDLVMDQWDVTVIGNIHDNPEPLKEGEDDG